MIRSIQTLSAKNSSSIQRVCFVVLSLLLLILFNASQIKAVCNSSGYYNVKTDFGAVGDGTTDDTLAIKNAVDCVRNRPGTGGGTVYFPEGFFRVANSQYLPIDLPSGITIVGVSGKQNGSSRIQLGIDNASIFRIGGNIYRVTIRDITLRTTAIETPGLNRTFRVGTRAIYGDGPTTSVSSSSSYNFLFSNMDISGFERAIDIQAHDTNKAWQFDQVKIDHVAFYENDNDIYLNTINLGININNCILGVDKKPYSILSTALVVEAAGAITLQNTQGSGPPINRAEEPTKVADTFIWIKGQFSTLTLINSVSENFYNSLVNDFSAYDSTIHSVNSTWGDYILLRANTIFVSTGSRYGADTVHTIPPSNPLRMSQAESGGAKGTHGNGPGASDALIYSVGDRFNYTTSDIKYCPPYDDPSNNKPTAPAAQCKRDFYLHNDELQAANKIVFRAGQTGSAAGADDAIVDIQKPIRIGNGGCPTCHYRVERDGSSGDGTLGYLGFSGKQTGYIGFKFNGPVLPEQDNTSALGNATHRWSEIRAVNVIQGDSILSDKVTGELLYKIHEDKNYIYFDDIRSGKNLMRLDQKGNLYVAGRIIQQAAPMSNKTKSTGISKTKVTRRRK